MRLKTKLLLSILSTIFVIVVLLSALFLGQLLNQRIAQAFASNNVIAHEILFDVRHSLETGIHEANFDPNDPVALRRVVADTLRKDPDLQSIINSVIRYSPTVYDIAVVDTANHGLIGTDPSIQDQFLAPRDNFETLVGASIAVQVRHVFGRPRVYDVAVPLERNGQPFAIVRVGIRTTFLKAEMVPALRNAALFSAVLIAISVFISALLSNAALYPISVISSRLDELSQAAQFDELPAPERRPDEVAIVSTKIERLGKRMRSVEEVFSALKENLDQVLGNLQDGLILFTRDGRAVLVSTAAARFLNRDRDRILGCPLHDVLDRNTILGRTILDAFGANMALLQEEVRTESGACIQVSLDFIHDDNAPGGGALGALLTLHDAETAQQLEDELELSRRLAAIGRLTSGVGHEVKNPINAIVVHLELLRNKMENPTPEAQRHLEIIRGEIQRLARVVQTLVDFSRPVELTMAPHDVRAILTSVLELESVDFSAHNVELELAITPEPLPVHVDADLLKQALLNLLQNAVQAMPRGGKLEVSCRREARLAVLTIQDHGTGISPAVLDKIFNLYFTTKPSGSGIGLAVTYRILQLHNGHIFVNSMENVGTTFTLQLPLLSAEQRPQTALPA
jgi:signal transduction histidine kinase